MGVDEDRWKTDRCLRCEWKRKCILFTLTPEELSVMKDRLASTIRILSSFRKNGIISTGQWKQRILLHDRKKLQAVSGHDQPTDFGMAWPD